MNVALEYLEARKLELEKSAKQLEASLIATNGALQMINHLVDKAKEGIVALEGKIVSEAEMLKEKAEALLQKQ